MPGLNDKNPMRLDADEKSVFFKRQLEYVKRNTYDIKYKNLRAKEFIPVSTEIPTGADTWTWRSYDKVGVAKIIADYAHDFPRVDVYAVENTLKIKGIGASYGYSIQEIRASQFAGNQLETRRANTARRSVEEKLDNLAWFGDANYNLQGFIGYPGVTEATVVTGTWATATPDEIVGDVTALMNAITVPTKGKEVPDTLIMPRTQYNIIKDKRMTDGNSKTVLTYLMEVNSVNNPGFMIEAVDELEGQGAAGSQRMYAYMRDPEHLTQEIPQMFEMFDADKEGMEYVIPCHARFGGVCIYYLQAVAFMDGI